MLLDSAMTSFPAFSTLILDVRNDQAYRLKLNGSHNGIIAGGKLVHTQDAGLPCPKLPAAPSPKIEDRAISRMRHGSGVRRRARD